MGTNKLSIKNSNSILLIAPCGMNCTLCYAYQRTKNLCPGCGIDDDQKSFSCTNCRIKNCKNLKNTSKSFCYDCISFPCKLLNHIDKRYHTKYNMSMIDNLVSIKKNGIKKFILNENKKWVCRICGESICVHKGGCLNCSN